MSVKHMKMKEKLAKGLAVVMAVALVFTSNNLEAFGNVSSEASEGIYGDFYVTDADGNPVTNGNGVAFNETTGILTITASGYKVTMRSGVNTTEDRIVFNCSGSGASHTYIHLQNITINTTKGIAFENQGDYSDEVILGDCILIGTAGVQINSGGGNMVIGSDTQAASLIMQGTAGYGFRCSSTIGFFNNGNSVTIIGSVGAVNVASTTYLYTTYSNMKAGTDASNLNAVSGFADVNNNSELTYVVISPDTSHYITYNVTYNTNGGTGSMNDSVVISGRDFITPTCSFKKDGSVFKGWSDGAGNIYQPGDVISSFSDNISLSATWEVISPSVTSVSVTTSDQSVIKGNTASFSATVTGHNNPSQTVTWRVEGATSSGTFISNTGVLTVADDESAVELIVRATADADITKSGTSTITLVNPTYTIQTNVNSKDFGSLNMGYMTQPTKETITITNEGNSIITLTQPSSISYNIGELSATTLDVGEIATFTIQPKPGLTAGTYSEGIIVETNHSTYARVDVSFKVNGVFSVTITPADTAITAGSSQELEAMPEGGSGTYSYQWYAGTSLTAFSTGKSVTVSPAETTTYMVIVNDSVENKTVTATITVNAAEPTGLTPIKPSDTGASDGKITGITSHMEYSTTTEFTSETTTDCTGTEITALTAGTYYIRVKAASGVGASDYVSIIVPDGEHTFSTEWSHDTTYHWHAATCSHTDQKTDVAQHIFTNYIYNNNATYFADGTETGSCICGTTDIRTATGTKLTDNVRPNVTVTVKTRSWTNILSTITFGVFFKGTQEIQITALDNESGLDMVQYYVSSTQLTEDEVKALTGENWKTYDKDSKPTLTIGKHFVYAKVTDKVNNKTYVGTDGIVIYQDSLQNTTELSFIKNVSDDIKAEVTLNGNTIGSIWVGSGSQLTEETDYETDNETGTITFKKSYLNTINPGSYILTIVYKPQGEVYQNNVEEGVDKNEAPTPTTIVLTVRKPKLISITAPTDITALPNGIVKTAQALCLPDKIVICTEDSHCTNAKVIWDLDALASGSYSPNVLTEQTFTLNGEVEIPDSIDTDGKSLTVTIQVTVNAAETVGVPVANLPAGLYKTNQNLVLTTPTGGADIYYTTDGSIPSRTNGTKYTGKIAVTGKEGSEEVITIKAIAVKEKMQDSNVVTFTYTLKIPATKYAVTVTNGTTEDSSYVAGAAVAIIANEPVSGKQFKNWTVVSGEVTFADANSIATTFTMPAEAVIVQANYENIPLVMITPSITSEPKDAAVLVGDVAIFSIVATGTPDPTYQWQVDCNDGKGFVDIEGANGVSYTILKVDMSYNGFKYRCVVTNDAGSDISCFVRLTVKTDTDHDIEYTITIGIDKTHTIGTDGTITVTYSGGLDKLIGIYVDGELLDTVNYSVKSVSNILTLKSNYLNNLRAGTHKLKFVYSDGSVETTFIIKAADMQSDEKDKDNETFPSQDTQIPDTGDNSPNVWLLILVIVSAIVVLYVGNKKKIQN